MSILFLEIIQVTQRINPSKILRVGYTLHNEKCEEMNWVAEGHYEEALAYLSRLTDKKLLYNFIKKAHPDFLVRGLKAICVDNVYHRMEDLISFAVAERLLPTRQQYEEPPCPSVKQFNKLIETVMDFPDEMLLRLQDIIRKEISERGVDGRVGSTKPSDGQALVN